METIWVVITLVNLIVGILVATMFLYWYRARVKASPLSREYSRTVLRDAGFIVIETKPWLHPKISCHSDKQALIKAARSFYGCGEVIVESATGLVLGLHKEPD